MTGSPTRLSAIRSSKVTGCLPEFAVWAKSGTRVPVVSTIMIATATVTAMRIARRMEASWESTLVYLLSRPLGQLRTDFAGAATPPRCLHLKYERTSRKIFYETNAHSVGRYLLVCHPVFIFLPARANHV